jgi:hypothetical protein
MNTADVLQETVKAYPSRAPVVIVAPLFLPFSHMYINSTKRTTSSSHRKVTFPRHDIAETFSRHDTFPAMI